MKFHAAPLPHEWMIASIIGFFVSFMFIYGDLGHRGLALDAAFRKWGMAFMLFFIIIFIASMVTMTAATTEDDHIDALAAHHKK